MKGIQIERNFTQFVVFAEDSILSALSKITANQSRLIFVVSEAGILQGVLTDGDFRRWIATCGDIDLNRPVTAAMNPDCRSAPEGTSAAELASVLTSRIIALPLLDSHGRIVAVALPATDGLQIGNRKIGQGEPSFVIAEIGNNHNGDIGIALQLIDAAQAAGADCAKFQMRDMSRLYGNAGKSDDLASDLGTQYTLDLLERFQLTDDELFRCFDHAADRGLIPLCTPWDETSLDKLNRWGMEAFKVASADFTNHALISQLAATGKPLICSTGMANELEIRSGIKHLQQEGASYVLLHCNSTYPTPFKDVNLRYLDRLRELAEAPVGYSGHERGIEVPIAAVALGASVVEKHITIDRNMEGNDHKVSLLPDEFAQMMQGIRRVEESMGQGGERSISQGEMMNREVLAKSLVAACDIPAGTEITASMIRIQSPGQGLQPNRLPELLGRRLPVDKAQGDVFFPSDLKTPAASPRRYQFEQPFGLPVRYHDIKTFSQSSNLDLVEIHLSYKDLDVDLEQVLPEPQDIGLVIHAPELFAGDHTLDLCTADQSYRTHSVAELQRVIDISRDLRERFRCSEPVLLVTNVGGFSEHRHLDRAERIPLRERLLESLKQLSTQGEVEIIPQTMPPFPWHFGGQRFHNLFVDSEFIADFCKEQNMRVCLDASHSKLACNHLHSPFREFLRAILPYTAHLHLADAKDVDGEGLQIHDGEIDWVQLFELVQRHCPRASFIPEIWQGHKNAGEGAWLALERLEESARQSQAVPLAH
ncbi:acetylneuraminic acid synthetase [Synechococcus sp. KORDI-100]|uniref:N-acetylneuraminate synthase family protein n=1 Tax=Synechococcus sp. KORDI-100 TaxID=1280380 RepID=UPI0004E06B8A|nr:N-acetylneuraminate synthase family protein [Synechococcus sp. KORDI-100]AII44402.1 acetylneuraminic acid synthetase [Synechococcus sp. KORDI-100]